MKFKSYPKIHRLGKEETDGILDAPFTLQEKIDLSKSPDLWQEVMNKVGTSRVPVVQWGRKFTVGYNPGELMKLIQE